MKNLNDDSSAKTDPYSDIKFGREFIFFNPFDEKLLEYTEKKKKEINEKEKEQNFYHQNLKNKTFSSETKKLIGSLTSDSKNSEINNQDDEHVISRINHFQTKYENIKVSPFLTFLNEAYFDTINEKELISILRYFTHSTRIYSRTFAVMKYDRLLGAYKTMATANLSKEDKDNFYLLKRDSLFHLRKDRITFLNIKEDLKNNQYFSKRFSHDTLNRLKSMLIIPMHRLHVLSYLIFFYFTSKGKKIYPDLDQKLIQARLGELSPALKSFVHEQSEVQVDYKELRKELQTVSNMGDRNIIILKIVPKDHLTHAQFDRIKKSLETELGYNDRFIWIHSKLIYVMIEKSDPQYIVSLFRRVVHDFRLETRHFPDFGYNYYSYL